MTVTGSLHTAQPHDIGADWATFNYPYAWAAKRISHAGRYITTSAASWKALKPTERDALFAAGIALYLIWEVNEQRPLGGASQGKTDGTTAGIRAAELGYPPGGVVLCANDTDVWAGNIDVFEQYNRAFAWAVTKAGYAFGLYGDHDIAQRVIDVCEYVIVPNASAWSKGVPPMNVVARQGKSDDAVGWDYPTVVVREFPVWTGQPVVVTPPPIVVTPPVVVTPPPPVVVPPVPPVVVNPPLSADSAVQAAMQGDDVMYFFYNSDAPNDTRRFLCNGFVYRHVSAGEAGKLGGVKITLNTVETSLPLTTVEIAGMVDVTKAGAQ